MAPEYTDEQEEGEHVYHRQNVSGYETTRITVAA